MAQRTEGGRPGPLLWLGLLCALVIAGCVLLVDAPLTFDEDEVEYALFAEYYGRHLLQPGRLWAAMAGYRPPLVLWIDGVVMRLFGLAPLGLAASRLLWLPALGLATRALARARGRSGTTADLAASLVLVAPLTLILAPTLMQELPLATLVTGTLALLWAADPVQPGRSAAAAGGLAGATLLVKWSGALPLLPGLIVWALWKRPSWRVLALGLGCAGVTALPWYGPNLAAIRSFLVEVAASPTAAAFGASSRSGWERVGHLPLALFSQALFWPVAVGGLASAFGLLRARRIPPLLLSATGALLLMMATPNQQIRFLLPLLPMLVVGLVPARGLPHRWRSVLLCCALLGAIPLGLRRAPAPGGLSLEARGWWLSLQDGSQNTHALGLRTPLGPWWLISRHPLAFPYRQPLHPAVPLAAVLARLEELPPALLVSTTWEPWLWTPLFAQAWELGWQVRSSPCQPDLYSDAGALLVLEPAAPLNICLAEQEAARGKLERLRPGFEVVERWTLPGARSLTLLVRKRLLGQPEPEGLPAPRPLSELTP